MHSGVTGLKWLLDDHLGSTADGATGSKLSELRYKPWGEIRYASQPTMTSLRYTGQRMEGIGLYDYWARWCSKIDRSTILAACQPKSPLLLAGEGPKPFFGVG